MKKMKKILATLVAVVMVMALAVPAFAASSGSIKIINATKGATYEAYKIFDATANGDAVAYTTNEAGKNIIENSTDAPFTVAKTADSSGNYAVTRNNDAIDADVVTWISKNYKSFSSSGTEGTFNDGSGTYVITELDYGYYYVTSSVGTVISIDTVTGTNKEIKDKNTQGPNAPSKDIIEKDETGKVLSSAKTNDAKVGTTESFRVSYNATNWVTEGSGENVTTTQVKNFYIKDTPTGLDIDVDTVKVTVNGKTLTNTEGNTAYTATKDNNGTLIITIPWVDDENNESLYNPISDEDATTTNVNIPVVVTYDAKITTDAATQVATNEVHIYYKHDSTSGIEEVEVTDPENPPKTNTYTYKFQLNKTDENKTALAGAQFELYDGETAIDFVANGDTYRLATADDATTTTTIDMTENATVYITGLDNKSYTLKETKAPDGYNLAADTTIYATTASIEEGENVLTRVDSTAAYTNSSSGKVTVVNRAGATLPTTGGIGTTIFYALGAILVIGAGVALIVRRRMNSER